MGDVVGPEGLRKSYNNNVLDVVVTLMRGIESYGENSQEVTGKTSLLHGCSGIHCSKTYLLGILGKETGRKVYIGLKQKTAERAVTLLNGSFEISFSKSKYQTQPSQARQVAP